MNHAPRGRIFIAEYAKEFACWIWYIASKRPASEFLHNLKNTHAMVMVIYRARRILESETK